MICTNAVFVCAWRATDLNNEYFLIFWKASRHIVNFCVTFLHDTLNSVIREPCRIDSRVGCAAVQTIWRIIDKLS